LFSPAPLHRALDANGLLLEALVLRTNGLAVTSPAT
jgi:hypothetical protein